MPYLEFAGQQNLDLHLSVELETEVGVNTEICRSNFKYMYWNMAQQLAHHTVNGCNVRIGDLMGSGTISGPATDSYGSMLELAWSGTQPLTLADGSQGEKGGVRVGFGEVRGKIIPAH